MHAQPCVQGRPLPRRNVEVSSTHIRKRATRDTLAKLALIKTLTSYNAAFDAQTRCTNFALLIQGLTSC